MLENLSGRFADIIKNLRGRGRLTAADIARTTDEIRAALLDADVALPVVRDLTARVARAAEGREVEKSTAPGQAVAALMQKEIARAMGAFDPPAGLNLKAAPPAVIIVCGMQGCGKTTTLAKLAYRVARRDKKRTMLASCDVRRPAAIEQLRTLAQRAAVPFADGGGDDALARAEFAVETAKKSLIEALFIDTAGRRIADEEMMAEIGALARRLRPVETLFVVDAMQGQDALESARAFAASAPISGIILAKLDGDARGGAALSAKSVVGRPVKFAGVGEKIDDLEEFNPRRLASRILGLGDVAGLIEQARAGEGEGIAAKIERKLAAKRGLDLTDLLEQFRQAKKMGGVAALADKLPRELAEKVRAANPDESRLAKMEAAILSMTPRERRSPAILKASRKRRIAAGAGVPVQVINQLLRELERAQKMMKHGMASRGAMQAMRGMLGA